MTDRSGSRGRVRGMPNPIDVHVGKRVRLRRTLVGISQEELGRRLRLTFQQVQKYERGANRVGASRLFDLARVLDVPVSFFFDDMPEEVKRLAPGLLDDKNDEGVIAAVSDAQFDVDPLANRQTLELARDFNAIADDGMRAAILTLVKQAVRLAVGGADLGAYFDRLAREVGEGQQDG